MSNERSMGLMYFLNQCSNKYANEEIRHIRINCSDRGNENESVKEYSMCYNKNIPHLKQYCGPDWVFFWWPSANIHSYEDTKNQIILKSNTLPTIKKVGWFGNLHSPLQDVIESFTRPLLKKIGDENPDMFDIVHICPVNCIIDNRTVLYDLICRKKLRKEENKTNK